jgi:Glycosyl hydrolase family 26
MRRSEKIVAVLVAAAVALLVGWVRSGHHHHPVAGPAPVPRPSPAFQASGYHLGVVEENEFGSYQAVTQFGTAVGEQPDIVLYYNRWGEPFQRRFADEVYAHGAVPFAQMSPGTAAMAAIAAGNYDAYLRSYANQVRAFRHRVMTGFAAEMNGDWDPWGWRHTSPAAWVAAWRHVVDVFRQQGATNVIWVWTVNRIVGGSGPIRYWWPGASYVTWVGIDGYYFRQSNTFSAVFGSTVAAARRFTHKPILIAETGVGPIAGKQAKIPGLFAGIIRSHLIGLIWFDVAQHQGLYHQDWRLEGDPAAVAAFRAGLRSLNSG